MSIWTRLADVIAAIGDSVDGFLQTLINRKPTAPEKSIAFTVGMIGLGAKMAKADGVVTEVEIEAFKQVFHVPDNELPAVARVFNLAKQDTAGFESYARKIAKLFDAKHGILEDVIDGLFHIAKADEAVHPAELSYLLSVARIFGFSDAEFRTISARHVVSINDPYAVLGLPADADVDTVKLRYRELAREYHPDRHVAAGVPEEMIEIATDRMKKVNEAYGRIMKERVT